MLVGCLSVTTINEMHHWYMTNLAPRLISSANSSSEIPSRPMICMACSGLGSDTQSRLDIRAESGGQNFDSPMAFGPCRCIPLRIRFARLQVVQHHGLRVHQFRTGVGDGEREFSRDCRHAVTVAVQQFTGMNRDAADAHW